MALGLLIFNTISNAQTAKSKNSIQNPSREIGLRMNSLNIKNKNNFELVYKQQSRGNSNKFMRYRLLINENFFIGNKGGSCNCDPTFNLGAAIGRESRINFTEQFRFIHGFELSVKTHGKLDFGSNAAGPFSNIYVRPELGYVLGFQYQTKSNLTFSLETTPSIGYEYNAYSYTNYYSEKRTRVTDSRMAYGLNFKPTFSITYKFK